MKTAQDSYTITIKQTSFPEQIFTGPMTVILHIMFSKVPSCAFSGFWTLTLKSTLHFDLIYNIGKSDCHFAEYHENRSR